MHRKWLFSAMGFVLLALSIPAAAQIAPAGEPASEADAALLNSDTLARSRAVDERNATARTANEAELKAFQDKQAAYLADVARSRAADEAYRREKAVYEARRAAWEAQVRGAAAPLGSRTYVPKVVDATPVATAAAYVPRKSDPTLPAEVAAVLPRLATVLLPAPNTFVQLDTRYFLCGEELRLGFRLRDGYPEDEVQFAGEFTLTRGAITTFKAMARRQAEPLSCRGQTVKVGSKAEFEKHLLQHTFPNGDEVWSAVDMWQHLMETLSYVTFPAPWPQNYAGRDAEVSRDEARRLAERVALLAADRAGRPAPPAAQAPVTKDDDGLDRLAQSIAALGGASADPPSEDAAPRTQMVAAARARLAELTQAVDMAASPAPRGFNDGVYAIDGGGYSISVAGEGDSLVVVEPNKRSQYVRQPDGTYHFFNPNTGTTFGLRVVSATMIEAFQPLRPDRAPTSLSRVGGPGPPAVGPDRAIAEKYAALSKTDPDDAQTWTACAAAAMKRSVATRAEADAYGGKVAEMLKTILVDPNRSPCEDALPSSLW
ncbi:hypothetical protein M9M90_04895 [Phenylobacterium sp. LH3H17]|uniref:hypothetical protein n=1 Tax=Phenylobacterium sp. LH3H17 TaxID=2903901 RepID=UPI0020CA04EC|nr:hypothetical protein [Phenylobacterium sp. LH3H17]UTP40524.1 hypothetical protein M9M90_04895 [Phenylobacterium sp. LH3H17]